MPFAFLLERKSTTAELALDKRQFLMLYLRKGEEKRKKKKVAPG